MRTLQKAWPQARFSWVIGKAEAGLLRLAYDIEFIPYDGQGGLSEYRRVVERLRARRFDLLLHMQPALGASALALAVRAPVKLGFDRPRARGGQWLFTTHRIARRGNEHVLDSLFGFAEALGVHDRELRWDLPLPPDALAYARLVVPDSQPTLVISPCSGHPLRDWRAEHYAAVADHAAQMHHMRVVLVGSAAPAARRMAGAIVARARSEVVDMTGRDTLPRLLGLLGRTDALLTPDAGPAHMATMVGTPVIGLYAATRSERSGPYLSRQCCVDRYAEAARRFLRTEPERLPWGTNIELPGVMDLIEPHAVTARLDAVMRRGPRRAWHA